MEGEEAEWEHLGEVPFRKWAAFPQLAWDGVTLEDHLVCGAPNGGPLAVLRDDRKLVAATADRLGGFLRIYSASGLLLGQVPWEVGKGRVMGMGWTEAEELVVILETGAVFWYSVLGQRLEEKAPQSGRLFADGSPRRVLGAEVWAAGFVALADDYTLHVFDGTRADPDARLYRLASGLSGQRSATALAVLQPFLDGPEGPGTATATGPTSPSFSTSPSSTGVAGARGRGGGGGGVQVVVATSDNCLLVVDARGSEVYGLQDSLTAPVTKMAVAPDGRFIGCFAEGLLAVYATANFSKVLDQPFDAGTAATPAGMAWCGPDSLVLHWRQVGLLMVGPYGDYLHFPYHGNEALALVPEVDCLRIVTARACEVLQRVPPATEAIHRIGSTEPAAMLFDAMEAFEKGDPKADENVRSIILANSPHNTSSSAAAAIAVPLSSSGKDLGSSSSSSSSQQLLQGAIQACLQAALGAWDVERQAKYLHAAAYGKGFYDDEVAAASSGDSGGGGGHGFGSSSSDELARVCRMLRVLNHLRRPGVGVPMTAAQAERQGWPALVDRLVGRREHFLALKVCDYLRLRKDRVLEHWACEFLQSRRALALSDEQIRDEIRAKFHSALSPAASPTSTTAAAAAAASVSYARIARTADAVGRRGLATMLLDLEPLPASQVDLLLELREFERALARALASGDVDLVYRALLHIEARKPSQEWFLRLLGHYPAAAKLLRVYHKSRLGRDDRTPWFNLALARGDFLGAGSLMALQAYAQDSLPRRIDVTREAARLFGQVKGPGAAFFAKATEEQAELLEAQQDLERRTGKAESVFVDMSVSETIYNLIVLASDVPPGRAQEFLLEAAKVQKRFKVPEKRFWYIKVKALAASGQWEQLRAFANEKKSPVGYKPFAQACIEHKQPSGVVEGYIDRIPQLEDKFDLYVEVRLWQKAADTAFRLKDPGRLRQVRASCGAMPGLQRAIDDFMAKL